MLNADIENNFFVNISNEDCSYKSLAFPTIPAAGIIKLTAWGKVGSLKLGWWTGRRYAREIKTLLCQLHLRHYMHNVLFGGMISPRSIMYQFALSRADENLRLVASSLAAENRLGFFMAIRSQLELNAHVYYLANDEEYAQRFHRSPEDRVKDKDNPELIKNILTLVRKYESRFKGYKGFYDYCSSYIHPNPSTALCYIRPSVSVDGKVRADSDTFFQVSWFRDDGEKKQALQLFNCFIRVVGHFIQLFDDLDEKCEVDSVSVKDEAGPLGLFRDLARKQEVLNLRAKMEGWSSEKYQAEQSRFIEKMTAQQKLDTYRAKIVPMDGVGVKKEGESGSANDSDLES